MHFHISSSFTQKMTYEIINPVNARIPLPKAGEEQAMEYLYNLDILKTGMTELFFEMALVSASDCLRTGCLAWVRC